MADVNEQLNQVEWAQSQPPARPPSGGPPKWLVPAVVGVVAVGVAIAGFFVIRGLVTQQQNGNEIEQQMAAAEFDCQDARDIEKCEQNVPARLAKDSGDAAYCDTLEGDAKDACISGAAKTALDDSLCRKIQDDERQTLCEEAIFALTMDDDASIEACEGFSEERLQDDCESDWIRERILAGECDHEAISDTLCTIGAQYQAAIDAQNPDLCTEISDPDWTTECEVFTSPGDRDFDNLKATDELLYGTSDTDTDSDDDGLMDGEEVNQHGTDPANPDTDGDGYDDGTEIQNGFDPLA